MVGAASVGRVRCARRSNEAILPCFLVLLQGVWVTGKDSEQTCSCMVVGEVLATEDVGDLAIMVPRLVCTHCGCLLRRWDTDTVIRCAKCDGEVFNGRRLTLDVQGLQEIKATQCQWAMGSCWPCCESGAVRSSEPI